MQSFDIDVLREDRAIVMIRYALEVGGTPVERHSPVYLLRAEDGTWQICDY